MPGTALNYGVEARRSGTSGSSQGGSRKCFEENLGLMESEQTLDVPSVLIHGSPCTLKPACRRHPASNYSKATYHEATQSFL